MFKKYLSIFTLVFVFSHQSVLAEANSTKKGKKTETESYLEAVKAKDVEDQLVNSSFFKECQNKGDGATTLELKNKAIQECVAGKFENIDDKTVEKLAKDLDIASFDKEASKSSTSTRKYLLKRLEKKLYGNDPNYAKKKFSEKKLMSHELFYQMYQEQIGKNVLLEVGKYCLENFGVKGEKSQIVFTRGDRFYTPEAVKIDTDKRDQAKANYGGDPKKVPFMQYLGLSTIAETNKAALVDGLFTKAWYKKDPNGNPVIEWAKKFQEYEVCSLGSESACEEKYKNSNKKYRSVQHIKLLKDAEFTIGQQDPTKKHIADRFSFCSTQVLQNMCEVYKCQNVYNNTTPQNKQDYCGYIGASVGGSVNSHIAAGNPNNPGGAGATSLNFTKQKDQTGSIACNVLDKLNKYRAVIASIDEIIEENRRAGKQGGKFAGLIDPNKILNQANVKVNDILTMSSEELVSGIDDLKDVTANIEDLKAKCFEPTQSAGESLQLKANAINDKDCNILAAKLNKDVFLGIETDTQAKAALKAKEIEGISGAEDLEDFLKRHNVYDKYKDQISDLNKNPDLIENIKALVTQDFKAQRMAELDRIQAKFDAATKIDDTQAEGTVNADGKTIDDLRNEVANQTLADMEKQKTRMETLFQYSNIVSSYLELKDKKGNKVGTNVKSRNVEADGMSKSESGDQNEFAQYFQGGGQGNASSGGKANLNYLQVLDNILGNTKPDTGN